jgi:L-iditol 2-dehydrogenase
MTTKVLGSYAEYLLIPRRIVAQNIFKKPEHLSFDEAAFLEPLACVVHGMEPLGIRRKDTVLIMGAGPIGLLHLLRARALGAKVLVTGLEEERLKTAKMLGAAAVFHPALAGEAVGAITDGRGVDYVFECTGQPQVWENSVDYVRRGGTVVLFGGCRKGATVTYDAARLHYDEITLKGTFHFTPQDVRKAFVLLKKGTIVVKKLISGSCGLNGIQDVFARLSKGEGLKYAVRP